MVRACSELWLAATLFIVAIEKLNYIILNMGQKLLALVEPLVDCPGNPVVEVSWLGHNFLAYPREHSYTQWDRNV